MKEEADMNKLEVKEVGLHYEPLGRGSGFFGPVFLCKRLGTDQSWVELDLDPFVLFETKYVAQ